VVAAEVTDSKRMEQERAELLEAERAARGEIERVNRVKDEFLATVSHELRSPLSAILGWARLANRGRAPDPAAALGIIERSATYLAQLVDDLLDMSRIISGKVRLSMNWVAMDQLLRDAIEGFRIAAQAKKIQLVEEIAPGLDPIRCDANRIQQVVWNLLSNAIKFTPEGGRITVRLEQAGDRV
jgi:signal transduction histidine kinase